VDPGHVGLRHWQLAIVNLFYKQTAPSTYQYYMYGRGRSDGPYLYDHDTGNIATDWPVHDSSANCHEAGELNY